MSQTSQNVPILTPKANRAIAFARRNKALLVVAVPLAAIIVLNKIQCVFVPGYAEAHRNDFSNAMASLSTIVVLILLVRFLAIFFGWHRRFHIRMQRDGIIDVRQRWW